MPYIAMEDRQALDGAIDALAESLVTRLTETLNGDTDVSVCYGKAFLVLAKTIYDIEVGGEPEETGGANSTPAAAHVAMEILRLVRARYAYRGAWAGCLNYAVTRLIQLVPAKMVERKAWKEEVRYWLHAQTVGALQNAALRVSRVAGHPSDGAWETGRPGPNDWVIDALVGVLIDVKDEYKRRVNSAYEAVQIRRSGDCYTTPYRTELIDVKDKQGNVVGYQELMKDYRTGGQAKGG